MIFFFKIIFYPITCLRSHHLPITSLHILVSVYTKGVFHCLYLLHPGSVDLYVYSEKEARLVACWVDATCMSKSKICHHLGWWIRSKWASLAILDGWMQCILCGPTHAVCIHSTDNQTNFFLRLRIHLARMKEMQATKHIRSIYIG